MLQNMSGLATSQKQGENPALCKMRNMCEFQYGHQWDPSTFQTVALVRVLALHVVKGRLRTHIQ